MSIRRPEKHSRDGKERVKSPLIFALLLCAACCTVRDVQAQSLEQKLRAATDYVPKATAPLDQLVEIAQRFKIPMGVEWIERDGGANAVPAPVVNGRKRTVQELVEEIVACSPEHRVAIEDGLLRVYSPTEALHPLNFLNILLKSYFVNNDDLFAADDQLRWAIRFTLTPEKYSNGYVGGYGHGSPEVFELPKFTLSANDITIREVLNRIVEAQGNSMWLVTHKGAEFEGRKPYWKGKDADEGDEPVTTRWRFIPLSGIAELAEEQLAVDVSINGLFDKRMSTIPVMMEQGLHADKEGAMGGAYEDGSTYSYGARIEKVERDGVMLSVELKVKRAGEAERKFDKKFEVKKGQVREFRSEPGIWIRAYFEARSETTDDHK